MVLGFPLLCTNYQNAIALWESTQRSLECLPLELNLNPVDCLKNVKRNTLGVLLRQSPPALATGLLTPGPSFTEGAAAGLPRP